MTEVSPAVETKSRPARRARQPKAFTEIATELPLTLMVEAPPEEKPKPKRAPAKKAIKEGRPATVVEIPEVAAAPAPAKAKAPRTSKARKVETVQEVAAPVAPKKPRAPRKKKSNDSEDAPATGE